MLASSADPKSMLKCTPACLEARHVFIKLKSNSGTFNYIIVGIASALIEIFCRIAIANLWLTDPYSFESECICCTI